MAEWHWLKAGRTCEQSAKRQRLYEAAYAAVMYGVQADGIGSGAGISKDDALDIAGEFFEAMGRDFIVGTRS